MGAIVIVSGAWHVPAHYSLVSNKLEQAGFVVECPHLPTANNAIPPTASLGDDIAAVREVIEKLVAAKHQVLVLAHSYGGVVAAGAITPEMTLKYKSENDSQQWGVVHAVYMSAFVIPSGGCLLDGTGGASPPWIRTDENGCVWMKDPKQAFYPDLSDEEAEKWLAMNVAAPLKMMSDRLQSSAFEGKWAPSATYLVAKQEKELTVEIQTGMARGLGEGTRIEYVDAGHCPMTSKPDEVVRTVQDAFNNSTTRADRM